MANFDRLAMSRSDWTSNELLAYNITVVEKDEQEFFSSPLPEYTGPAGFIQHADFREDLIQDLDEASLELLKRFHLATTIEDDESSVDGFVVEILQALGYQTGRTLVFPHQELLLSICGEKVDSETDVCIKDMDSKILLLAQEDKSYIRLVDLEAHLVAKAIAAFQMNNAKRHDKLLLPQLQSYVFPGLTMVGTFPRFYKIQVTHDLDLAVRAGQYPVVKTIVERHTPCVPGCHDDGMGPLDSRVKILRCFEAFKRFVHRGDNNYIKYSRL